MEKSTHIPPSSAAPGPADAAESLRRGHEQRDVNLRAVIWFMVVLGVSVVAVQLVVWILMRGFEHRNERADPLASPFAAQRRELPQAPLLQPSIEHNALPYEDMERLRKKWRAELDSYGHVEGQPDRARIPIDRAMQILVERGLGPATRRAATTQLGGGR